MRILTRPFGAIRRVSFRFVGLADGAPATAIHVRDRRKFLVVDDLIITSSLRFPSDGRAAETTWANQIETTSSQIF
ncbi:MAG: hypothetical protein A2352_02370 [Caulobacterales bacterium RIFOXYB1_FULL_67_16]|nr:MAG: hypothetical protein A2352_02370 [Caulobacterales bacterium RIFOXYB1_FULL_67_16]